MICCTLIVSFEEHLRKPNGTLHGCVHKWWSFTEPKSLVMVMRLRCFDLMVVATARAIFHTHHIYIYICDPFIFSMWTLPMTLRSTHGGRCAAWLRSNKVVSNYSWTRAEGSCAIGFTLDTSSICVLVAHSECKV